MTIAYDPNRTNRVLARAQHTGDRRRVKRWVNRMGSVLRREARAMTRTSVYTTTQRGQFLRVALRVML